MAKACEWLRVCARSSTKKYWTSVTSHSPQFKVRERIPLNTRYSLMPSST